MDVYAATALVSAIMSALAAAAACIISFLAVRETQLARLAALEEGYAKVRSHNRVVRRMLRANDDKVDLAIWYYEKSTGDAAADAGEVSVEDIENALDGCSTFWDVATTLLANGLLPRSFCKKDGEWAIRAKKYMQTYEPLDIANWYRYQHAIRISSSTMRRQPRAAAGQPSQSTPGGSAAGVDSGTPADGIIDIVSRYGPHRPARFRVLQHMLAAGASSSQPRFGRWLGWRRSPDAATAGGGDHAAVDNEIWAIAKEAKKAN